MQVSKGLQDVDRHRTGPTHLRPEAGHHREHLLPWRTDHRLPGWSQLYSLQHWPEGTEVHPRLWKKWWDDCHCGQSKPSLCCYRWERGETHHHHLWPSLAKEKESEWLGVKLSVSLCQESEGLGVWVAVSLCEKSEWVAVKLPVSFCEESDWLGVKLPVLLCEESEWLECETAHLSLGRKWMAGFCFVLLTSHYFWCVPFKNTVIFDLIQLVIQGGGKREREREREKESEWVRERWTVNKTWFL